MSIKYRLWVAKRKWNCLWCVRYENEWLITLLWRHLVQLFCSFQLAPAQLSQLGHTTCTNYINWSVKIVSIPNIVISASFCWKSYCLPRPQALHGESPFPSGSAQLSFLPIKVFFSSSWHIFRDHCPLNETSSPGNDVYVHVLQVHDYYVKSKYTWL